jgi:CHAT domain-containing protein
LTLEADQFLGIELSQDEIDVAVAVRGPAGFDPFVVDSPNGNEETERLWLVAQRPGDYLLTVRRRDQDAAPASYTLRVSDGPRPATDDDRHRAAALRSFVRAEALRSGSPQAAAEAYADSRDHWRHLGLPPAARIVWRRSLWLANDRGEIAEAVEICAEAACAFDLAEPSREAVRINYECGTATFLQGSLERAWDFHHQSLLLAQQIDHRHGQASALQGMAQVARSRGDLARALRFFRHAYEIFVGLGNEVSAASTLHNLGKLLIQLDDLESALDHLRRALAIRLEIGDLKGAAGTLAQIGFALVLADRQDEAVTILESALERLRVAGSEHGKALVLGRLGKLKFDSGDLPAALEEYRQALRIFERLGDLAGAASAQLDVGLVQLELGRIDAASASLIAARSLLDEVEDQVAEAHLEAALARMARRHGDLAAACGHVEKALEIIESLRASVPGASLRASHFATWQDFYDLYVDLLMEVEGRSPDSGSSALAFQAAERARARSLLDSLAGMPTATANPAERDLRGRIASVHLRLLASGPDRRGAEALDLERQLRRLLLDYQMLRMENNAPASERTGGGAISPRPLRLEEVQRLLDDDTLLLSYYLGEQRSFLWLIGPSGSEVFELSRRSAIEDAAERVHRLLQESHNPQAQDMVEPATEKLGELVLAPVAGRLGTARLIVVGDGKLRYVPFAALPDPASPRSQPPRLLLHGHEIVQLPSASVLAWLRERRTRRSADPPGLTLIGDPVFDAEDERFTSGRTPTLPASEGPQLTRLRSSRLELEAISELAAPERTRVLSGFEADKEVVLRTLEPLQGPGSPPQILHFATHSLLDDDIPELSTIVLSQVDESGAPRDGMLHLYEISRLRLSADLVVLSACETAGGRLVRGEGLVGMTHGFLAAGASRVLASLWRVEDQATTELMRSFYRELLQNHAAPAAALRTAQLEILEDRRWRAPYFWAGFVLQGEWL